MNYLLGLIFTATLFVSSGQTKDLLRIEELNTRSDYYLNVNRDSTCHFAQQAHLLNNNRYSREKVKTFLLLGMCQKFNGNMDSAYALFTHAKILADELDMQKELGLSYWYRGKVFFEMKELEKAKPMYKKAIEVFSIAGEFQAQFKALNGLAYLEQKQGNMARSLEYHMNVLEIVDREKFHGFKLRTYANVAEIYLQMGDKLKGLEFNAKSLQVVDTSRYKGHLVSGMIQRANLYDGTGNSDSTLYFFTKALDLCQKFELGKGFVHEKIGLYYDRIGNHEEAIRNFRKGLEASKVVLTKDEFLLAISKNYLATKNYDSALFFAKMGYQQAQNCKDKLAIHESSKILADVYEAKGDMVKSNKYLHEYAAYKDSVFMGSEQRKLTDLQVQLETIDKKHEIESLKSKAEVESFRRLIIIRGGSFIVFSLFVAIALIVKKYKKKQKTQQYKAASLKNEIEKGRQDLSNQSLHLIRVNNSVLEIEEKLKELKPKVQGHSMEVQRLINTIRMNKSQDKDWENFNNYFNGLNSGFADRMRAEFPSLTINEIRLCSLLKMNLLNGEIASILNVETRSVTMSKYRLKKKLNLGEEVDLGAFLMNLEFSEEEKQYA